MKKNCMFKLNPLCAAIVAVGSGTVSLGAIAQDSGFELEEVVVTAQRRETSLQETPIAVTAFSGEQIAERGIFDVTDIGSIAPNTNIQKQPSSNSNMSIFIRGVGSGETSLMADPKTSFYIDGVYMSKTVGAVFDIVDLQSVEVLRGPQGTLFGRNSTGGAVNVTTVKPSGELGFKLEGSVGNDGYTRFGGTIDMPKVADMLSIKVSGMVMNYDGWAENTFPGRPSGLGSEDNESFRVALRFEPTDALTIDYSFDTTDNEGAPVPFQITEVKSGLYNAITNQFDPLPFEFLGGQLYQEMAALVGDPNSRREQYELDSSLEFLDVDGHTLTVAWELDSFTLKYIYADRETTSTYESTDLDGGNLSTADLFYGGGQVVPTPGFVAAIDDGYIELETHEFQIIGSAMDGRLQYTAGVFAYEEEIFQSNPQTFGLPITFLIGDPTLFGIYSGAGFCDPATFVCTGSQRLPLPFGAPGADPNLNGLVDFVYGQTTESLAVYGQFSYDLTDALELTAGLRWTEDDREAFLFNENLNHVSIDDRLTGDDSWDNISYLLTLNWGLSDRTNVYFTTSTGFNSGGFNSRAGTVTSWDSVIDEEDVTSYEIGLKADWLDNRVRSNIAVFYNDYQEIQISQFEAGTGGASSRIVNAGEATFQGIELDLIALLTDNLTLDMTYGFLDAEFDKYLLDQNTDISAVTTVPRAPENSGTLGLQYEVPVFSGATLMARLDVIYTDGFTFHPFNNQFDSADDRTLLNARISLKDIAVGNDGRLRISAWGKNITDEEYREWGIDFASLGYAGATYGRPATYGLDVTYEFR